MPQQSAGIEVDGLRPFLKGLKQLEPELDKALKAELRTTVAEPVAADARRRLPGRAGQSIRAGADAKGPWTAGGKKAIPWYGWQDFGSRSARTGQWPAGPWKNSGKGPKGGRAIYPAIAAHRDAIIDAATAALNNARDTSGI